MVVYSSLLYSDTNQAVTFCIGRSRRPFFYLLFPSQIRLLSTKKSPKMHFFITVMHLCSVEEMPAASCSVALVVVKYFIVRYT